MAETKDLPPPIDWGFGTRLDGTFKGPGFAPGFDANGDVVTELSAGPAWGQYPLVYEGIPPDQAQTVRDLSAGLPVDPFVMRDIQATAFLVGLQRLLSGVSPFYDPAHDGPPKVPVLGNFGIGGSDETTDDDSDAGG